MNSCCEPETCDAVPASDGLPQLATASGLANTLGCILRKGPCMANHVSMNGGVLHHRESVEHCLAWWNNCKDGAMLAASHECHILRLQRRAPEAAYSAPASAAGAGCVGSAWLSHCPPSSAAASHAAAAVCGPAVPPRRCQARRRCGLAAAAANRSVRGRGAGQLQPVPWQEAQACWAPAGMHEPDVLKGLRVSRIANCRGSTCC